jgi:hypothetical protein
MAGRRARIQVRTLKVLELVQKGIARAEQTSDEPLKEQCASLLSAVMPHDIRNVTVSIAAVPHEQQIEHINEAIAKGAAA